VGVGWTDQEVGVGWTDTDVAVLSGLVLVAAGVEIV
jgi:hypothetical protein